MALQPGDPGYNRQRMRELKGEPPVTDRPPTRSERQRLGMPVSPRRRATGTTRKRARPGPRQRATSSPRGRAETTLGKLRTGIGSIQAPTGYQHVLMGEMIVAFVIIGIRAIADYVPASDQHSPGTEQSAKGASPIILITATLGVFFVLSFLATRGGYAAKTSAAFGLLMIVALMINSEAELSQVAGWIKNIGSNNTSQATPQTSTGNADNSPPVASQVQLA